MIQYSIYTVYDSIPLCSNSQKTVAVNTSMGSCWRGDFTITYTGLFGYVWNRKVSVHANYQQCLDTLAAHTMHPVS